MTPAEFRAILDRLGLPQTGAAREGDNPQFPIPWYKERQQAAAALRQHAKKEA